jgi:hypothetical protein
MYIERDEIGMVHFIPVGQRDEIGMVHFIPVGQRDEIGMVHFIPVGQRDEFNISFLAMCVGKKTQQYLYIYMYIVHLNGSDINPTMKIPILSIADLCGWAISP